MLYIDNKNGDIVRFINVPEAGLKVTTGPMVRNGIYSISNDTITKIEDVKNEYLINCIDIDWNGIQVDNSTIRTTGDLIRWIKKAIANGGNFDVDNFNLNEGNLYYGDTKIYDGSEGITDLSGSQYIPVDSNGPKIGTLKLKNGDNNLLVSVDIKGKQGEGGNYTAGEGINISNLNEISVKTATSLTFGGIKTGYTTNDNEKNYKVDIDQNGNAFVNVPWQGSVAEGFEVKLSTPVMPVGTDSEGKVEHYVNTCLVQSFINNEETDNVTITTGTISRTNGESTEGVSATVNNKTITVTLDNITDFIGNSFVIPVRVALNDSEINYDTNIVSYGVAPGKPGEDGTDIEFIYTRNNTGQAPSTPNSPAEVDDWYGTDQNGIIWTDNPQGVEENLMYEYATKRYKKNGEWGAYVTPFLWSKWGEKGQDGDGFEYIFTLSTGEDNNPGNPTPSDYLTNTNYLNNDEYAPYLNGWYDDPLSPTSTDKVCWVSKRKKTNDVWGRFSNPAVWSRYTTKGQDGGHYEWMYQNSYEAPTQPANAFTSTGVTKATMAQNGWSENPTTPGKDSQNRDETTWWTKCFVSGEGAYGMWSQPARVSGTNGIGLSDAEKRQLQDRQDQLDRSLDSLSDELTTFKNEEAERVLGIVDNQLSTLNGLKTRYESGDLLLNTPTLVEDGWNSDLNEYLRTVGILERNKNNLGLLIDGYRSSYSQLELSVNSITIHADAIEELFEKDSQTGKSKIDGYDSMLAAVDANTAWRDATGEGGKAAASLTTFFANSGLNDAGKAKVIKFVSSGFKTESESEPNKYKLDSTSELYTALSQVFALYEGDNPGGGNSGDAPSKEELLAYIRAKVESDKHLASSALVADSVNYKVQMERATDSSKGALYIDTNNDILYLDGSTYKKLSDNTTVSGTNPVPYMIPIKDEYGRFIYELATLIIYDESTGNSWTVYLWVDEDLNEYGTYSTSVNASVFTMDSNFETVGQLKYDNNYESGATENKYYFSKGWWNNLQNIILEPMRIEKQHNWAGVLTEANFDRAFASLYAQEKLTNAKASVTSWAVTKFNVDSYINEDGEWTDDAPSDLTNNWDLDNNTWYYSTSESIKNKYKSVQTFVDVVAEKVPGGTAEVTLAAMMKNEAKKYWNGSSWNNNAPDFYKLFNSPDDVKYPGAFLKLAINEDNDTSIKLEADHIDVAGIFETKAIGNKTYSDIISDANSVTSRVASLEDTRIGTEISLNGEEIKLNLTYKPSSSSSAENIELSGLTIHKETIDGKTVGAVTVNSNITSINSDKVIITSTGTSGDGTLNGALLEVLGNIEAVDAKFNNVTAKEVHSVSSDESATVDIKDGEIHTSTKPLNNLEYQININPTQINMLEWGKYNSSSYIQRLISIDWETGFDMYDWENENRLIAKPDSIKLHHSDKTILELKRGSDGYGDLTTGVLNIGLGYDTNADEYITTITSDDSGCYFIGANFGEYAFCDTKNDIDGHIYAGELTVNGQSITSDSTLKDIVSDTTLTVELIANAPAVNFTWKKDAEDENKKEHVGTLAQYWEAILPQVISTNRMSGKLSMEYSNAAMVSSIVTAKEVVALKQENEDLKQRISQLEEWVNNLRNSLNN